MLFIAILFLTTLSIAGTAAFFSVYGLAQLFQGMAVPVMIMGGSLEAGKLVAASFLYRYWYKLGWSLRVYLVSAVFLLMVITSVGIFGMLSLGYQSDTLPLKEIDSKIELLKQEQSQLQARKKEIDQQISQLPENYVKGRQRLMSTFASELKHINARLPEITSEMQKLNTQQIHTQAHVGPIVYIAKAFGGEVDDATKYIILLLIVVFDPLAVALTIGVNVALKIRRDEMGLDKTPQQTVNITVDEEKVAAALAGIPAEQSRMLSPDEIRMIISEELKNIPRSSERGIDPAVEHLTRRNEIVSGLRSVN